MKKLYTLLLVAFASMYVKAQTYEGIDLGLSVDWASFNYNAGSETDFGGYYGWADPTGIETTSDVLDSSRNWISDLYGGVYPPSEISETELDIIHVQLGDGWRMPTLAEMKELLECSKQWTRKNGIAGYEFTGKNGNKIFLPAGGARTDETIRYAGTVGYYWTGTLGTDPNMHNQRAHRLYMGAEGCNTNPAIRYSGFSIRPVRDKNHSGIDTIVIDESIFDNNIYDIYGRKLKCVPEKGFYIKNGRKYVVK